MIPTDFDPGRAAVTDLGPRDFASRAGAIGAAEVTETRLS
jgi:hypothetical protein